jgi:hypothetical protein
MTANGRAKIMKTYVVALTTLLLVSSPDQGKAQGNLVFNGGFDTSAVGWTLTDGAFYSGPGNPGGAVQLDGGPSSSNDPTASQTINSLTPGAVYIVSGDYQRTKDRLSPTTNHSFGVAINGILLFQAASSTNIDLTWYSFSFPYTATGSSALLSLSSQINGTGLSYAIDNIAMYNIPEPSSFWLMAIGGILSAAFFKSWKNNGCNGTR